MRVLLLSLWCVCVFATSVFAGQGERVALVIGNSDYRNVTKLTNPRNDASAVAKRLEGLGFRTRLVLDADKAAFEEALSTFSDASAESDISLVYFAGHGMEMNGQNYLIPTNATLATDAKVGFETVTLDDVLMAMETTKGLKMVLLDACRDNPFLAKMERKVKSRSIGRGLAAVEPVSATLISFAASAGTTAADGDSQHSPYTAALLQHLDTPGLEVGMLFRNVAATVQQMTAGQQIPFEYARLPSEPIFIHPSGVGEDNVLKVQPSLAENKCLQAASGYNDIKFSDDIERVRAFTRFYAGCGFDELAKIRLDKIDSAKRASDLYDQAYDAQRAKNYEEAIRLYRASADLGDGNSMNQVGWLYQHGLGVQKDPSESIRWFMKAREAGNIGGTLNLAHAYIDGIGVQVDLARARAFYEDAMAEGNADAEYGLGHLYYFGKGVDRDYARAAPLFEAASKKGKADASFQLAQMYAGGLGFGVDQRKAAEMMYLSLTQRGTFALNEMKTVGMRWPTEFRMELQRILKERKLYQGAVDGAFGGGTLAAIDAAYRQKRKGGFLAALFGGEADD